MQKVRSYWVKVGPKCIHLYYYKKKRTNFDAQGRKETSF